MSNDNKTPNKGPDTDHVLDSETVVSSSDFTGLLQGLPKENYIVGQYSDVHSMPEQGGLNELRDNTETKVH